MKFTSSPVIVSFALFLACGSSPAAENAAPTRDGKLVVSQTFESAVEKGWRTAKGDWKIVDGAWQGAEIPADMHGAVARYPLQFTDAVIEFDFKLDGAKGISLSINDAKEHVCRLSINTAGFVAAKDDHDHDGPDMRVVLYQDKSKLDVGKWHHARLEIVGDQLTATIDGHTGGGKHELIATRKANFGFTVSGQSASFKNLTVTLPKE